MNLLLKPKKIIRNGLVAWYKFDEGQGQQLVDWSIYENHGENGSATGADPNDATPGMQGWDFGGDDYVRINNADHIKLDDDFTIMLALTRRDDNPRYILSKGDNNYSLISGYVSNTIEFYATGYTGDNPRTDSQLTSIIDQPELFSYAYSPGSWRKSKNGQPTTVMDVTFTLAAGMDDLLLGKSFMSDYFSGILHYFLLYNRALTDALINRNYHVIKEALAKRGVFIAA